jgi:putative transposase
MQTMSRKHAVFSLGYHIIWCPKYRHAVLDDAVAVELKRIIAETCCVYGWELQEIEVMPDHVLIFVQADQTTAPVQIAQTLKSISAVHIFHAFPKLKGRKFWGSGLWSRGTYYATVGHISETAIRQYIESQKLRQLRRFHPTGQACGCSRAVFIKISGRT